MPYYNVSVDLLVPVLLEIEAESEEDAETKLYARKKKELLTLANTEEESIGLVESSITVERGR